jgi:hypothetical protein
MGDWGNAPWDNDEAADWFGVLCDQNRIAEFVTETLLDVETSYACVRAAASFLIFLGRAALYMAASAREDEVLAKSAWDALR